jgi:hypothetical protein
MDRDRRRPDRIIWPPRSPNHRARRAQHGLRRRERSGVDWEGWGCRLGEDHGGDTAAVQGMGPASKAEFAQDTVAIGVEIRGGLAYRRIGET